MWLSQRFYYTLNRRSKIIHLKSDAFSSEMHLVFLNAQKSWLWIWFLCSKKCDLNWCRQPGFIWFWKKVNFCFQHSTAKIWQHKHRKSPTPPGICTDKPPKQLLYSPVDTLCPPTSTQICICTWPALFGCCGNSEGPGKRLVVWSQAPFTAWGSFCTFAAWGSATEGTWKIFCSVLLNTTYSSGYPLPKRR